MKLKNACVSRSARKILWRVLVLVTLAAGPAAGQAETDEAESQSESSTSNLWAVVGASQVNIRGDCQFCRELGIDDRITHSWGLAGNIGVRVTPKTDVGAEVFWTPFTSREERPIRATFLLGVVQFRPWESQGFFVKLGIGMAFTRTFVIEEEDPITQKALAVLTGGGWAFRRDKRIGFQVHGNLHVAALGDFTVGDEVFENVMGNFWSLGGGIVIR